MKELYMIYERDFGHTGVTFDNEKSAQEYLEIANFSLYDSQYFICKRDLYSDLNSYISSNKQSMIYMLERAIRVMISSDFIYSLEFKNGKIHLSYNNMKDIVENNRFKMSAFYDDFRRCEIADGDLVIVKEKYNELTNKVNGYKNMIIELKEELNKEEKKEENRKSR